MHAGEREAVESCFQKLEKLIHYADKFTNAAGLIEAPPHLQSKVTFICEASKK